MDFDLFSLWRNATCVKESVVSTFSPASLLVSQWRTHSWSRLSAVLCSQQTSSPLIPVLTFISKLQVLVKVKGFPLNLMNLIVKKFLWVWWGWLWWTTSSGPHQGADRARHPQCSHQFFSSAADQWWQRGLRRGSVGPRHHGRAGAGLQSRWCHRGGWCKQQGVVVGSHHGQWRLVSCQLCSGKNLCFFWSTSFLTLTACMYYLKVLCCYSYEVFCTCSATSLTWWTLLLGQTGKMQRKENLMF